MDTLAHSEQIPCSQPVLLPWDEDRLHSLLRFIRGELLPQFGQGITTYPDEIELPAESKHLACLELERRGLIRRHYEGGRSVTWLPVPVQATTDEWLIPASRLPEIRTPFGFPYQDRTAVTEFQYLLLPHQTKRIDISLPVRQVTYVNIRVTQPCILRTNDIDCPQDTLRMTLPHTMLWEWDSRAAHPLFTHDVSCLFVTNETAEPSLIRFHATVREDESHEVFATPAVAKGSE